MDSSDFTDTSDSSPTVKGATRPTAQARKSNMNLTAPGPQKSTFAPLAPCVPQSSAKSKSKKSASSKDSSKPPTSVYVDGGGVEGSSQPDSDGAQAQERIDFRREISAVQSKLDKLAIGQSAMKFTLEKVSSNLDAFIHSSKPTIVAPPSPDLVSTASVVSLQQLLKDKHDLSTKLQETEEVLDTEELERRKHELDICGRRFVVLDEEIKERDEKIRELEDQVMKLSKEKKKVSHNVKVSATASSNANSIKSKSNSTSSSSTTSISIVGGEDEDEEA